MRFTNHIAYRFLTDDKLAYELIEEQLGGGQFGWTTKEKIEAAGNNKIKNLWNLVNKYDQKSYIVTDSVSDRLDMLKVKRDNDGNYDWTIFNNIKNCKKTFIIPRSEKETGGGCVRILKEGSMLEFCYLSFNYLANSKNNGTAHWVLFFVDSKDNRHAEYCAHKDVQNGVYEYIYKLLCFVFLSDNEEEEIKAGASKGTKKNGKIKNDFNIPLIVINSKWNVTSVRTDGFMVSGHFALRRVGIGRSDTKMVFIKPYEKHGYIRKAKSLSE